MEGLSSKTMMSPKTTRRVLLAGGLLLVAGLAIMPGSARAQTNSVLLFPAVVDGNRNENTKLSEEIVTEAIRIQLAKVGVTAVVYSKRLPSVQRALSESDRILTEKDIDEGPGDDTRKAQRFAEVVGATEYLTVFVDNYVYDGATRTAKFNLSLSRYNTITGKALGTFANGQQGIAPADVVKVRQEGSALARASETGAQQGVATLFPQATKIAVSTAKPKPTKGSKARSSEKRITTLFGAFLGILYFSTR
jgi:hypothetical protein